MIRVCSRRPEVDWRAEGRRKREMEQKEGEEQDGDFPLRSSIELCRGNKSTKGELKSIGDRKMRARGLLT